MNKWFHKTHWYKQAEKWKDHIPGGRADGKKPSDFDHKSIEKGKEIEFEHTNDPDTAREIAMDHLEEHEKYYDDEKGLPNMEKKLKKDEEDTKPALRGRYPGQTQGDENREKGYAFDEILSDNDLVEGEHVERLRGYAKSNSWTEFKMYVQKLKEEGHSPARIDSMVTRSTAGIKF